MAVSRFRIVFRASIQQIGEPLQKGDHLFFIEHARRDKKLARSGRSEGRV
jgi:hypothetical protein